jgi:glycosyltransferase involved in cell wall biosynthesis
VEREKLVPNKNFRYERLYEKISAYTTTWNCLKEDFPFRESIVSALSFASEVVVVDGCSTDGTYEALLELQKQWGDDKIKLYQNEWDLNEPGQDGLMKAFSRALCENPFLVQFDVDEVFSPDDVEKWKMLTKRFPKQADILHLPVIELWGPKGEATTRRHLWKWRMSRNKPEITHGINVHARLTNEKTGRVYAREGMSDGCEYVNTIDYQPLSHVGFYTAQMEEARLKEPEKFAGIANEVFSKLPTVHHYSWFNLPRKIQQLKKGGTWDILWSGLYQQQSMERFPGIETEEQVLACARKLYEMGGEESDKTKGKFTVFKPHPLIMKDWIRRNSTL